MDHKHCHRCKLTKPSTDFGPNKRRKDGLQTYCRPCIREYKRTDNAEGVRASRRAWYAKNSDRVLAQKKAAYLADPEPRRARSRKANRDPVEYARHLKAVAERNRRLKADVFAAYGGYICACCGEINPGFLTVDHVNGCGKELRKVHGLGSRFYLWLKRQGFPPGFQILCYNCNMGRAHNGGVCPHKC